MKSFFENTLHIAHDGNLHINEVIGIAILVIVTVLAILLIRDLIKKAAGRLPDGERPYSAITRTGIRPVSIRRENTEEHFLI